MRKLFCFPILCIVLSLYQNTILHAQGIGVNSSGNAPDPSSMLDVSSTTKGQLIPRMTTAQRDLIANPAIGLLLYNTDTGCINMWLGSSWKKICGDCDFTNPVPGNNGPICESGTLNLTSTNVGIGATYQWTGPNGFVSTEQNPSIPNAGSAASGSYSLTATLNGCTSVAQSTVATVIATPQTPVASNTGPYCAGNTLSLSAPTITGATYSWTGPNSFTAGSQHPTLANVQTINGGTYSVIASVSGCNSAPGTTTVIVSEIPATPGTITGPATVTSYSSGNVYSINAVSGAGSYDWTVPSGASIMAGSGTPSITVTYGSIGSGNVSVTASNSCGTSSQSQLPVTITPTVVSFTTVGTTTWTAPAGVTSVEYLVVAGGGSGYNSGGGAGGFLTGTLAVTPESNYSVTVGAGGVGQGANGGNSVFGAITAIGGGGGANNTSGFAGGSGGGAGWNANNTGGAGTAGQGNAGGNSNVQSNPYPTGGGGGALSPGGNATPGVSGNGGAGRPSNITGTTVYYAGGGGGGLYSTGTAGAGGIGGGGAGCAGGCIATSGAPNTGGGGGGVSYDQNGTAGNGGSGIVIIAY